LRAGDRRNFEIDVGRRNFKSFAFGDQVADLLKKGLILFPVKRPPPARQVPMIDLLLQPIALLQQRAVLRPQVPDDPAERPPKAIDIDARPRRNLVTDQFIKLRVNPQAADFHRFHACRFPPPDLLREPSTFMSQDGIRPSRHLIAPLETSISAGKKFGPVKSALNRRKLFQPFEMPALATFRSRPQTSARI